MMRSIVCDLCQIFKRSVSAVLPENLIRQFLKYDSIEQQLCLGGLNYNLKNKKMYVVGSGKAVQNMANEIENIFSSKIKQGIISIPVGSFNQKNSCYNILYSEGAFNNLPDENAMKTAQNIRDLVIKLTDKDFLLVLISGGGSALLPLPKESITLEEKTSIIKSLANSGADITELNIVRKRLSDVKGGQLAIKAHPANVVTLILSDVVGDPIDIIASGPTCKDETSPAEALDIISKYKLLDKLPLSIKTVLKDKSTIKTFPENKVDNFIIGSNQISIEAAMLEAINRDYQPIQLSNTVVGNVKEIANEYVKLVELFCELKKGNLDVVLMKSKMETLNIPGLKFNLDQDLNLIKNKSLCLILGGEPTVNVKGTGKGGRNQQLALEFSKTIDVVKNRLTDFEIYFLSAGTDGIDGPTDAAGAIGYKNLVSDCIKNNIDINAYIDNNDSYNFYTKFQNGNLHVKTGHTNTNVMDIHLIIIQNVHDSYQGFSLRNFTA